MNNIAFVKRAMLCAGAVVGMAALFFTLGYRYNLSQSYPTGIYKLATPNTAYKLGELVLFCPPNNAAMTLALSRDYIKIGTCDGGFTPVVKKIFAIAGDKVTQHDGLVHINGTMIENAQILKFDALQRQLPTFSPHRLAENEFFMMSDHRPIESFDSRYYGAVKQGNIIGHVKPVWTW